MTGIWIEHGLVSPGETVDIEVRLAGDLGRERLPAQLEIVPRHLESAPALPVSQELAWQQLPSQWVGHTTYIPTRTGNYLARITLAGQSITAHFAAWAPGIGIVSFWVMMSDTFHGRGNLKDLYLPELRQHRLPFDYEISLVGDFAFSDYWPAHARLRTAQEELGADVLPFFDGGYFHRLAPSLQERFRFDEAGGLPDPTFHGLTVAQCAEIIQGARRLWARLGYRPFTGISTYSPSHALLAACRQLGVTWLSGLFPEIDFVDGRGVWQTAWVQRNAGMPEFPYFVSERDFRHAGPADAQGTMIFPADRRNPVLNRGGFYAHGTDTINCLRHFPHAPIDALLEQGEIFFRNARLTRQPAPVVVSFTIQMSDEEAAGQVQGNREVIVALARRARAGDLVFAHKRHLQQFYRRHFPATPDTVCWTPDLLTGATPDRLVEWFVPASRAESYAPKRLTDPGVFEPSYIKPPRFPDVLWWEGADGKAAFLATSAPGPRVEHEGGPHLPVWWHDYRADEPRGERESHPPVSLAGVRLRIAAADHEVRLTITAPRPIRGLPIALWEWSEQIDTDDASLAAYAPVQLLHPVRETPLLIVRPDISRGETILRLPRQSALKSSNRN